MSKGTFEIYKGDDGQYYFKLLASNGAKISRSEGNVAKSGCENGIRSVKSNASDNERYQRKTATDGQF